MMMRMDGVRHIELRLFPDLFAYFNLDLTITPGEGRSRRNKHHMTPLSLFRTKLRREVYPILKL